MIARCALVAGVTVAGMLLGAGCGDPPARVALVPINPDACGRPTGATGLKITAYAGGGEVTRAVGLDERVAISDFPDDTVQLGVEVLVGGGAVGAVGKTAPLAFADLAEGATIPIFMAPLGGLCRTGQLTEPRVAPLVARAGDGVLVIGGTSPGGTPLSTAELYDPMTASFAPVAVPELLGQNGFTGSALATLPDGRVVLSGGPQPVMTVFDPATKKFSELVFIDARSFHSAIATDADHVLLAGGCSAIAGGVCTVRRTSRLYDIRALGTFVLGPDLRTGRVGATSFDLGMQADGHRALVFAGGTALAPADPADADRAPLDEGGGEGVAITGTHAEAAQLDGGAVLTAFGADADPAIGAASVIIPEATSARAIASAPERAGMRMAALEDGRVVAIGGASAEPIVYDPTRERWSVTSASTLGPLAAPSLVRLLDGSVLVVGGTPASRDALIYRPSLVGPQAGSVTVLPASDATPNVLTAPDPASVTRTATDWVLGSDAELTRALVGGPRLATGSVTAIVRVRAGGVALVAQQLGPGHALIAELAPGAPARLVRIDGATTRTLCTGTPVAALDPAIGVTVVLSITGSTARLTRDDAVLLSCTVDATDRGAWGVAALGAGARVVVDSVTVAR